MTPSDDTDLIDRLTSGISERQSGVSAPDRLGDDARRTARRRTATRAVTTGVPVLAAAGVATVLATGSGSGSADPGAPSAGSGPVTAHDTAYVVTRVKAALAETREHGLAAHGGQFEDSREASDGALTLGRAYVESDAYTASDGTRFDHQTYYTEGGRPRLTVSSVLRPDGGYETTQVNPIRHVYSRHEDSGVAAPRGPRPDLGSSPSQVREALERGQVTQLGTTAVDGRRAIALAVRFTEPARATPTGLTLYVDADSYRPLRIAQTVLVPGDHNVAVDDWVPATADTIAKAKDDSIPSGYTRVDRAY